MMMMMMMMNVENKMALICAKVDADLIDTSKVTNRKTQ